LAASWQTNLHLYARTRLAARISFVPQRLSQPFLVAVERWSFRAAARFYHIPRLLFAPNPETVALLEKATGKPCAPMPHSVDTAVFDPAFRDRDGGPIRLGYVGRLTPEKNVRSLARLEQGLLDRGHRDFRMVIVGPGKEAGWLRKNLKQAQFTGLLTGTELSRAYANMDVLVFPSETDTFGLVVLEALSSGVPAVVTSCGGPKFTVQHGKTGFVAASFDEFIGYTEMFLTQPELLRSMRLAARRYALSTSWEPIFEGMYNSYEQSVRGGGADDLAVADTARMG
jgi:phosphatidylinositol alpha 1,6-mannosyltransferase